MCSQLIHHLFEPQNDRKIRCDRTNSLVSPNVYDPSAALQRYAEMEAEFAPLKKPRFHIRYGTTPQPQYHPFTRDTGLFRLVYLIDSSGLLIAPDNNAQYVRSGSFFILPPEADIDTLLARGTHKAIMCHWEHDSTFVQTAQITQPAAFVIHDCSLALREITNRVVELGDETAKNDNLLLSWLNLAIYESQNKKLTYSLVPKFEGELQSLNTLIDAMKADPARDWNLNASANFAGYSPFHLSRAFRAHVGIGLPKFVEACRAELAVERLLKGNDPINVLAYECGFGSSQAMRAAIREFTGFLPTEIRGRTGE